MISLAGSYDYTYEENMKYDLTDPNLSINKAVWQLAWPTIVEQLLVTLVQYIDTAMVGSMGEAATAAIAVSSSLFWLISGLFTSCAIGYSVLVGKNLGAKNNDLAKRIIRQGMIAFLVIGALMTAIVMLISGSLPAWMGADPAIHEEAAAYMRIVSGAFIFNSAVLMCSNIIRSAGDSRTPLFFNTLTNVLNIIGNFLLIFPTRVITIFGFSFTMWGAGMGVRGAALSTALATVFSGCMLLRVIFCKPGPWKISLKGGFHLDRTLTRDAIKLALPAALERGVTSAGHIVVTALVTGLGTTALAANHLAIIGESLSYLPAYGLGAAATALVSQSLGAKQKQRAWEAGRQCTIFGVILMTCTGVLLFLFSKPLMSIFSPDEAVVQLGAEVLRIEACAQPFFAMSIVIAGVLRGAGDTKGPFLISVVGMWGVRMAVAYVLAYVFDFGLAGAWFGMAADLTVRGLISLVRMRKKKWLHIWN